MIILNCTKRVLDELPEIEHSEIRDSIPEIKEWYCNVIKVGRKKYFTFINSKTLFAFYTRNIKKSDFKSIDKLFVKELEELLIREVSSNLKVINQVLDEDETIIYRKATNRSKIGSLTEIYQQIKANHEGGIDIDENRTRTIHALNNIPMKPINWEYPVDALKIELGIKRKE